MKFGEKVLLLEDYEYNVRAPALYKKIKQAGSTYEAWESLLNGTKALVYHFPKYSSVLISTGFPIRSVNYAFENDGPIGAILVGKILEKQEITPIYIVEKGLSFAMHKLIETARLKSAMLFPITPNGKLPNVFSQTEGPLIVIEKPGKTPDGKYLNMDHKDVSDHVIKIEDFIENIHPPLTISIGDGGNEYGSGNLLTNVDDSIPEIVTNTKADYFILGGTSNLGSLGLVAALNCKLNLNLSYEELNETELVTAAQNMNLVDGVKGFPNMSVDGLSWKRLLDQSHLLWNIINRVNPVNTENT